MDIQSPLLTPIKERDYARSNSITDIDHEEVSNNGLDSSNVNTTSESSPQEDTISEFVYDDFNDDYGDDLGEKVYDGQNGSMQGDGLNMDESLSNESSEWTSKFLMDIFTSEYPKILHNYSKLSEYQVAVAENNGDLAPGSLDEVKEINKNNKKALQIDKGQRKMIEEPLAKVLAAKGVKMSPEMALIIAIIVVMGTTIWKAREIKKNNDALIDSLIKRNAKYANAA